MTTPAGKHPPFQLHFIYGNVDAKVKAHDKREFGWVPNKMRRSKRNGKRQKK